MLFVESMLPSGSSSNNFLLDCWVGVYDSLGATSSATVPVEVRFSSSSSSVSSSSLLEKSTALMSASDPSSSNSAVSESKLQVVSLLSSILNWKDCSLVPTPCSDLNREDCSSTTNTCGSCLSGYLGVTGDDNSLCVDEASFESSMSDSSVGCDLDSDCASWESCVSGMCEMKSKSCKVPDCSGHGECQFVDSESGDRVSSCGLLEMSCEATCFCDADYSGDHCDMSSSEMSDLQEIRSQMVVGLLSVASDGSDVSEGGLLSVLTSLSSVTRSPSELPLDSSNSVLEVLSVSLDQAEALKVSYESLSSDVLSSLNSVAMVQVRDGSETSSVDLLNLLGNFTGFVAGQLVADQSPVDSVSSMFRTRIQPLSFSNSNSASSLTSSSLSTSTSASDSSSSTITSSIPQTKAEIMSKAPSTSFSLTSSPSSTPLEDQGDGTVSLSLVSTLVKSSLVDLSSYSSVSSIPNSNSNSNAISSSVGTDSTQLTSNMLRLKMSGSGSSSISRIIVVLPTLRSQSYPVYESDEYVNTTCGADDFRETAHVCHGALGDVEITHHCDGTAGVIVSKCPRQSVQPSCSTAESSSYRCSVLNYTSISVTCVCELLTEGVGGRHRSLSTLSESGALEVSECGHSDCHFFSFY
jgi:trimeric autotransporter adhesin